MNHLIVKNYFILDHRIILKKAFPDVLTVKKQETVANRLVIYIEEFEVDITTQSFVKDLPNNINLDKEIKSGIDAFALQIVKVIKQT